MITLNHHKFCTWSGLIYMTSLSSPSTLQYSKFTIELTHVKLLTLTTQKTMEKGHVIYHIKQGIQEK